MSSRVVSGGVVHTVPMDLRRVLIATPKALAAWEDLTPLGRNEWICWVLWPKKAETRSQHVERLRSELLEGKRRPCCWLGCTHRKDKELSPSVRWVLSRRGKASACDASASQQMDDIVRRMAGSRGERLSQLRALSRGADPGVIEEV